MQKNIIVLVGPTGAGKSHFIDILAGTNWANKKMAQRAVGVRDKEVALSLEGSSTSVVLVDAPGFDDATRPDSEVVRDVVSWLQAQYGNRPHILGVLYFNSIKENRAVGRPQDGLHDFWLMCGLSSRENGERVVFVTTHWDVLGDKGKGDIRRELLQTVVSGVGGIVTDFEGSKASAEEIARGFLRQRPLQLNIDTTRVKPQKLAKPPKVKRFMCSVQ
ncbi:hypothetical protein CPB83DRAFT_904843 [Crepidotus variabilis]|uniref:G domain-containing protein n=1 Tax=Crepidotus variabilis TaxID=179855 RepID=A0A9P6JSU6_9AGAR|nr:hypothetical protein CPB83DRAFT_904843 [Crepidotus variabilis]